MSADLNLTKIKLGSDVDPSKNFLISTPAIADGTLTIERENGTDVLSIDVNGKVTCTLADNLRPVGVGQTWQDFTASRALNTTYTNNAGRPIQIAVWAEAAAVGQYATMLIGGVGVGFVGASGAINNGGNAQLTAIVPNGATYRVDATAAYRGWAELR